MRIKLYQVDAFAERVFCGNPAAVCLLESDPGDACLQAIANENNLSETAFLQGGRGRYRLRWFTPTVEVALCGHATLAAAFVVFSQLEPLLDVVIFETKSGLLSARRVAAGVFAVELPAKPAQMCDAPPALLQALGAVSAIVAATTEEYLVVYADEAQVRALQPDFKRLRELPLSGVIATAPGVDCDFVSRFFAPAIGIDEDPVTGAAHCVLLPYWSARLGKTQLHARQISRRGGNLQCQYQGEHVILTGQCVQYLEGEVVLAGY